MQPLVQQLAQRSVCAATVMGGVRPRLLRRLRSPQLTVACTRIVASFAPAYLAPPAAFQVGDPFDESVAQGPLVSEKQVEKVMHYIELGQKEGGLTWRCVWLDQCVCIVWLACMCWIRRCCRCGTCARSPVWRAILPHAALPAAPAMPPAGAKLGCGGKRWGDKGFYLEPTGGLLGCEHNGTCSLLAAVLPSAQAGWA